ncbi:MAG: hypothetical protein ACC652_14975, partial [Acidimicrobiales bacterium]
MSRLRAVPVLLVLVLFSAACADAVEGGAAGVATSSTSTTTDGASVFVGSGWIDGEPQWRLDGGDETMDLAEDRLAADSASPAAAGTAETDGAEWSLSSPVEAPPAGLSGGSIDDNEKFADYLSYRERIRQLGIPVRELEVDGRMVVTVLGANGLPASGAVVTFTAAEVVVTLRTTADGSVRFHPAAYGISDSSIAAQ